MRLIVAYAVAVMLLLTVQLCSGVPIPLCYKPTRQYKPVCGSDHKTYRSLGELKLINCLRDSRGEDVITMLYEGPCKEDKKYRLYKALTSIDKGNYWNHLGFCYSCQFLPETPLTRQKAPWRSSDGCRGVNLIFSPVCGTDGITYTNQSVLDRRNCKEGRTGEDMIAVAYQGPCGRYENSHNYANY